MAKKWPEPQPQQVVSVVDYGATVTITANTQYGNWAAAATNQYRASKWYGLKHEGQGKYKIYRLYVKATASYDLKNAYDTYEGSGGAGVMTPCGSTPSGFVNLSTTAYTNNAFRANGTRLSGSTKVICQNGLLKYQEFKVIFPATPSTYYYRPNPASASKTFSVWSSEFDKGDQKAKDTFMAGSVSAPASAASASAVSSVQSGALDRLANNLASARREMDRITSNAKLRLEQTALHAQGNVIRQIESIQQTAIEKLKAAGYSDESIAWYFDPKRSPGADLYKPVGGGGQSGSNTNRGSQTGTGNNPSPPVATVAPTPAVTKVIIRAPFGYAKPAQKPRDQRPQIIQTYTEYVKDSSTSSGYKQRTGQDVFYFPYTPNNVTYSGLGSEWVEVPRQGNYPVVEWSKWNLMRVEMEFLVADDRIEQGGTRVPDGLFTPVHRQLNVLRRMAQRQAAISIFNMDDLLRLQMMRAQKTGKAMQFVIGDLQITANRRSVESVEKEITAATVRLTLQEIPIESVTIVRMSPPEISNFVPKRSTTDDPDDTGGRLISPDLTVYD